MNDYFYQVIALLKEHEYIYLAQGSGGYEVWKKFSRHLTVPNRCLSRQTANSVMNAAKIKHRF